MMAHPGATAKAKIGIDDYVQYEYSQYRAGVESIYRGRGIVVGKCQVIASPGLKVRVTASEDNAPGSLVEVFAHRCHLSTNGSPEYAPASDSPSLQSDSDPVAILAQLHNPAIEPAAPDPEQAQACLF
jgi:hypothetical protein